jgi:4-coumarate--CoA ligase
MSAVQQPINVNPDFSLRSRWSCPIPDVDLCTFIFSSPTHELPKTPIYIAAEKPETHQLSMHSHRRLVKKIAAGLRATGLKEGDRVLTFSGNSVFFPSLYLGIIASGAVFTGANPTYTVRELAFQLQNSGARICIVREGSVETAVKAAEEVGLPQSNIFVFDDSLLVGDIGGRSELDRWVLDASAQARQLDARHWSELVSPKEDFVWHQFTSREEADRTAVINYSSGYASLPPFLCAGS